ncbi:hypothetical protein D1227_16840 [Henriciella mobilis]|uniref:M61 family metallopeptidase n=1 Tax=Henriciella mobilis TaxID=2305467 RepID=UPI000E6700FB|nr:hypothetical protein [Henriciella mobilis]RIJ16879.1 hypothetical protein D1231_06920 [Henriciella mobilis]RIJ19339.1 hypothetical protein D1227_16840 [Henriciella mobilis]
MSVPMRCIPAVLACIAMACLAAAGCTGSSAPVNEPAGQDAMTISIAPRLDGGDKVSSIDVAMTLPAPGLKEGDTFLSMAIVRVMAPSALSDPNSLTASDSLGTIAMRIEEDPEDPSDFRQDRRWILERDTAGNVEVRYKLAPRVITPSTRPGPLIDTRTELWGVYGSGNTMLALPVAGWPRTVRVDWNLDDMPAGARAASSIGLGNVEAEVTQQNLNNTFFMAGPLKSQPESGEGEFVVYWMTPAAFDLEGAAAWTQQAYAYFVDFFGQDVDAFRVFMRTTERFQGGGGGGYNSFIFGTVEGEDRDPAEVRSLLAHEAIHHFVGGYGDGGGAGGQQWYSEGATSYYTIVLPHRAGLTSLEDYIEAFNAHALNYYTNPQSGLSNEEVTRLFFSDSNAQLVPYNRGPLYFALLDYRRRQATEGRQRVDDLIFRFIDERDSADDPVAFWREVLTDTLGEAEGAAFDAMMAGAPLGLPADLFGPCFEGEMQTLSNFARGFRPYEDENGRTRIGPVTPGSPADAAGLQRFDIIANPDALEAAEDAPPGSPVMLEIEREDEKRSVEYVPWTKPAQGLQWTRTEVPAEDCSL